MEVAEEAIGREHDLEVERLDPVVAHDDSAGTENSRRWPSDWLGDMGQIGAGHAAGNDRYLRYREPYADGRQALDTDGAFQEETRNATRVLVAAVRATKSGQWPKADARLTDPRPE